MAGMILQNGRSLKYGLAIAALVALGGCADGGLNFGGGTDTATADSSGQSVQLLERDIESPQVFQVSAEGLWDGRPSLGGVWVAHPDVTDPERVIIRNMDNGKFVIGALFRRERDNPGPALQVSSDAADALGMLAGAPANLSVTALRREEVPQEATPAPTADIEAPGAVETTDLDPITEGAAAAISAAETSPAPAASTLAKPYVQIGIFSVEANANRAAKMMTDAGLTAQVVAASSQGKDFWRVIVGPSATAEDRAATLEKIKSLGFADAYFVSN